MRLFATVWLLAAAGTARAEECLVDDDCASGECNHDETDVACSSDGECSEPEPTPGTCSTDVRCESDSECPAGATCKTSESERCSTSKAPQSADGGVDDDSPADEPSCTVETRSECVYELIECSDDEDCSGADVCTAIGAEEDCSGAEPGAACTPGQECPEPEPAPEPECTARALDYCFPQRKDCSADADCEQDERCVELIEDFQEEPPVGWEGATRVCFIEALALALEGEIEIDGPGGSASDEASVSTSGSRGDSNGTAKGAPQSSSGSDSDSDVGSASDSAADSDSDGCAVATPGTDPPFAPWILLGLALTALARRKRN